MKQQRRSLQELNLLDDFLFGSMLNYPEIKEAFARVILETIFQRKFGKLTIIPQKTYYGADTELHGSRLDVYMEEGDEFSLPEDITIYDGEVDHNSDRKDVEALPKRVRFYHSIINTKSLASGESYRSLKKVVMIMIMDYDPFGRNRMCYTVRNQCVEEPDIPYNDGAMSIFFYTKGQRGIPNEEIGQLLQYMQNTKEENAVNPALKKIQKMVNIIKQDPEVTLSYMKVFEREQQLIEQGREEEQANTERERRRAENAEKEVVSVTQKLKEQQEMTQIASKVLFIMQMHPDWNLERVVKESDCSMENLALLFKTKQHE